MEIFKSHFPNFSRSQSYETWHTSKITHTSKRSTKGFIKIRGLIYLLKDNMNIHYYLVHLIILYHSLYFTSYSLKFHMALELLVDYRIFTVWEMLLKSLTHAQWSTESTAIYTLSYYCYFFVMLSIPYFFHIERNCWFGVCVSIFYWEKNNKQSISWKEQLKKKKWKGNMTTQLTRVIRKEWKKKLNLPQ